MKKIYSILTVICLTLFTVSCNNDMQDEAQNGDKGYLKLDVTTLISTNTRATAAPQGYNPKTIAVKIISSTGTVVKETQDVANDQEFKGNIILSPDTYTITASSAGWDGSDSGFGVPYYAGSTKATVQKNKLVQASLTLTQANVKVTVNYDNNFRTYFSQAQCIVTSALNDVNMQRFTMSSNTVGSAYFPVAALNFFLAVTNKSGQSFSMSNDITDVKARDHFIINYKIAEAGSIGGVTVKVDDSTQSYIFDIEVPRKSSTSLNAGSANTFTSFAYLTGAVTAKTSEFNESYLKLQWKKSTDADWRDVPASSLTKGENDSYSYKLTGLTSATEYVFRMNYNDGNTNVNSNEATFTTESILQLENSGFENWHKDGSIWYPNASGSNYWSTSNSGSAGTMGESYNVTTGVTSGAYNGTSANLQSMYVIIKFAAASLFTGTFDGMIGTNGAKLGWGVPFVSRPSALKGYMKYNTSGINRGNKPSGAGAPDKGENDACQIFCALLTERLKVANASNGDGYELTTSFNWDSDPRIIAYGQITQNTSDSDWKSFNIPLVYRSLTVKPKYVLVVCSSSKWGDYFYGSDSSNLKLDDFSFEYGEPTFK